jgi:hypothetical protein
MSSRISRMLSLRVSLSLFFSGGCSSTQRRLNVVVDGGGDGGGGAKGIPPLRCSSVVCARAFLCRRRRPVFRLGLQKVTSLSLLLLPPPPLPFFFFLNGLLFFLCSRRARTTSQDHTLLRAFKKYPTTLTTTTKARNVSFFFFCVCVCVRVCLFSPPFSFFFRSPSKSFFFSFTNEIIIIIIILLFSSNSSSSSCLKGGALTTATRTPVVGSFSRGFTVVKSSRACSRKREREREREREDALFFCVCVLEELLISSCARNRHFSFPRRRERRRDARLLPALTTTPKRSTNRKRCLELEPGTIFQRPRILQMGKFFKSNMRAKRLKTEV